MEALGQMAFGGIWFKCEYSISTLLSGRKEVTTQITVGSLFQAGDEQDAHCNFEVSGWNKQRQEPHPWTFLSRVPSPLPGTSKFGLSSIVTQDIYLS